jgi:hypothetical protein
MSDVMVACSSVLQGSFSWRNNPSPSLQRPGGPFIIALKIQIKGAPSF